VVNNLIVGHECVGVSRHGDGEVAECGLQITGGWIGCSRATIERSAVIVRKTTAQSVRL
jgi:hypothetical protein